MRQREVAAEWAAISTQGTRLVLSSRDSAQLLVTQRWQSLILSRVTFLVKHLFPMTRIKPFITKMHRHIYVLLWVSGRTHMPWTQKVLIKNTFPPLRTHLLRQVWAERGQALCRCSLTSLILQLRRLYSDFSLQNLHKHCYSKKGSAQNFYMNACLVTVLSPTPPSAH